MRGGRRGSEEVWIDLRQMKMRFNKEVREERERDEGMEDTLMLRRYSES